MKINKTGQFGLTLVELLLALGVLAIVLAYAASPLQRMSARADVDLARENIVHALSAARSAAVRANTPVRVLISENSANNQLVAGFSRHRGKLDFYLLPNYSLPEHVTISLTAGMSEIEYQPLGRVSTTGVITLSSRLYPEYVINIRITNLGGQLEVDDGLMQKVERHLQSSAGT